MRHLLGKGIGNRGHRLGSALGVAMHGHKLSINDETRQSLYIGLYF